jgi:hypothetical protein
MSDPMPKPTIFIDPGTYRHYKGGLYKVLFMALHSESLETMVVYEALKNEGGTWVRPAAMFLESVEIDGQSVQRFERIHVP